MFDKFSCRGKSFRLGRLFRSINVNMKLFLFLYFRFGMICVATRLDR